MSVQPERMETGEYVRRWRQAVTVSSWIAVRCALVAWVLGAVASYIASGDPLTLIVWAALGFAAIAAGFAIYAHSASGAPYRYPSLWKDDSYGYVEPPTFPGERKS